MIYLCITLAFVAILCWDAFRRWVSTRKGVGQGELTSVADDIRADLTKSVQRLEKQIETVNAKTSRQDNLRLTGASRRRGM